MTINKRRAEFVYEGARLAAIAAQAPIVPDHWSDREQDFKDQFLDVIERQSNRLRYCGSCAYLIEREFIDFIGRYRQFRPAKVVTICQRWMRTDGQSQFGCSSHGSSHDVRITSVQTTRHIGGTDVRQYRGFAQPAFVTIVFAEIAIQIDRSTHC